MKHSILFAGVLCLALAGCRYGKNADDADLLAGAGDSVAVGGDADALLGDDVAVDIADVGLEGDADAEDGIVAATEVPFDSIYAPVTDAVFAPVYFSFDANAISAAEEPKADAVAEHLKANPKHVVIVEGNCDERGSNEYNVSLGERRAGAIRDYLAASGVDAARIQTRSYGEEKPAVAGTGEEVWRLNRRGEFAIFTK
ncbi:MAG: OmpA family protein [Kiritimatiellae bacterium]|nr:OmpA family protein [Kiritimatiellia bacterium]